MCFHSKQSKKAQEVEHRFNAKIEQLDLFHPTQHYNGFSFPLTPVITNENPKTIQMIQWGLLPSWAQPQDWNRSFTLNARVETLAEKPAFRNCIDNRCLIIVDGFYEWQHVGKEKIKYEIGFHHSLFALGGLYDSQNGIKSYTIVTTEALGIMREIHNTKKRMPISLYTNQEMQHWLEGGSMEEYSYDFTAEKLSA